MAFAQAEAQAGPWFEKMFAWFAWFAVKNRFLNSCSTCHADLSRQLVAP
jgi:hypothetical protein